MAVTSGGENSQPATAALAHCPPPLSRPLPANQKPANLRRTVYQLHRTALHRTAPAWRIQLSTAPKSCLSAVYTYTYTYTYSDTYTHSHLYILRHIHFHPHRQSPIPTNSLANCIAHRDPSSNCPVRGLAAAQRTHHTISCSMNLLHLHRIKLPCPSSPSRGKARATGSPSHSLSHS